jgi:hypothetical protein
MAPHQRTEHAHPPSRRPWPGVAGAVALALIIGGCRRAPAPPGTDASGEAEVARLQRAVTLLERQIELASGKDFYLVLDPAAPDLTLKLRGAELQRFPVLGLQVGYPRVSWVTRRPPRPWQGFVWAEGELEPPRPTDRIVVTAVEGAKGEEQTQAPPIPPTAEELYPVPSRYRVRFSGGLSVEIRPREADANMGRVARLLTGWRAKWSDVFGALRAADRDSVRLRIVLNPKDAESLYRSLPPTVRILILPGSPPSH